MKRLWIAHSVSVKLSRVVICWAQVCSNWTMLLMVCVCVLSSIVRTFYMSKVFLCCSLVFGVCVCVFKIREHHCSSYYCRLEHSHHRTKAAAAVTFFFSSTKMNFLIFVPSSIVYQYPYLVVHLYLWLLLFMGDTRWNPISFERTTQINLRAPCAVCRILPSFRICFYTTANA